MDVSPLTRYRPGSVIVLYRDQKSAGPGSGLNNTYFFIVLVKKSIFSPIFRH